MAQPSRLDEIEQLIGVPRTLELVKHYGGTHIQFPSRYREDWEIALLLGRPAADQLIGRFSGTRLYIAKRDAELRHRRNRAIIDAYSAGSSVAKLARAYQLSDRQIWNILGCSPQAPRG